MMVFAYFYTDEPGSNREKACRSIFESRGGRYIGAGTWLVGDNRGERDVQYDVPDDKVDDCRAALKKAGFRLEPTPSTSGEG